MQIYCTFLSIIEDRFFFGFEKKINSLTNNLSLLGFKSEYHNINDLSFNGFIKAYKFIKNCKSKNIIIRTVGIKSFILLFFVIIAKKNKNLYAEVPTSFSTLSFEFKMNNNKKISNYIYFYLNLFLTPILLIFFRKIIYYDKEYFPYNLFIKQKTYLWQNGVDTNSIPFLKKIKKIENNVLNFVCVGSLTKWHGLERFMDSIIFYQKKFSTYKFNINLVGHIDEKLIKKIKNNSAYFKNGNSIKFLGLKKGKDLSNIFKSSNIGIGSIGLKNLNTYERSELKIREYTAAGLPFIMEADDSDFKKEYKFIFKIDKKKYNIDIDKLIKWFNNLNNSMPQEMRKFAKEKLDYQIKIKQFLNEVF